MVVHSLPPVLQECGEEDDENEDALLEEKEVDERRRYLEQTPAGGALETADLESQLDTHLKDLPRLQRGSTPELRVNDPSKHTRRKPLPIDAPQLPLLNSSLASHEAASITNSYSTRDHGHLCSTVDAIIEHDAQGEEEGWRLHRDSPRNASPPPSPHVRFALPLLFYPLPRTPSPGRTAPTRPTLYGARDPPWGSSGNLARDRRDRIDARTHEDSLTKRFELESRRLAQERRIAAEEIRTGKRWTEVDKLRELVAEIYPDMEFERNIRGRGCCCCCVIIMSTWPEEEENASKEFGLDDKIQKETDDKLRRAIPQRSNRTTLRS
ncbi:hypothetical protein K458DRAFT_397252 [Lentithecium fluviatile CBS 122367]|uniref:Uncharacterized protein n=1 Tax=Lentithecium fluviatile CBS 122367 TaxID=1168545 RepID=A0A6G1ID13_9PLEO|nr:hypothetical protein K458DRAFT_397252 [Lentithecium fluviatile CBS 122367]